VELGQAEGRFGGDGEAVARGLVAFEDQARGDDEVTVCACGGVFVDGEEAGEADDLVEVREGEGGGLTHSGFDRFGREVGEMAGEKSAAQRGVGGGELDDDVESAGAVVEGGVEFFGVVGGGEEEQAAGERLVDAVEVVEEVGEVDVVLEEVVEIFDDKEGGGVLSPAAEDVVEVVVVELAGGAEDHGGDVGERGGQGADDGGLAVTGWAVHENATAVGDVQLAVHVGHGFGEKADDLAAQAIDERGGEEDVVPGGGLARLGLVFVVPSDDLPDAALGIATVWKERGV